MTEWQLPVRSRAEEAFWSGADGVGLGDGMGVACSTAAPGFCAACSVGAWLATSGAVTNK